MKKEKRKGKKEKERKKEKGNKHQLLLGWREEGDKDVR